MKNQKYIVAILAAICLCVLLIYFIVPYLRYEGKYNVGDGHDWEFKDGIWFADGKEVGTYSYRIFSRTLLLKKTKGIILIEEGIPVGIHWDYIELPDFKGGRSKSYRITDENN